MRQGLVIAALVLLVDQVSKYFLIDLMAVYPKGIVLTPFFNLVQVWNRGVSFGILGSEWLGNNQRWLLAGLALAVAVALVFWLRRVSHRWEPIAIGLVIGGAVGNAIDRIVYGAVADFFDFHVAGWHWPAFNVADMGISCGAVALVVIAILSPKSQGLE